MKLEDLTRTDGSLRQYINGGYLVHYLNRENRVFCAICAAKPENAVETGLTFNDGPDEECTDCGRELKAYEDKEPSELDPFDVDAVLGIDCDGIRFTPYRGGQQ